jgi:tetratricopeptide (TPR) repeat protein
MRLRILVGLATAAGLALACSPSPEQAERAREAALQALERGDRTAALDAIGDLQDNLPKTPDALLEVAQLLVRAGDASRAAWLLEEGVERFPERNDLRVGLARVALLLGNPSLARQAVEKIPAGSEHYGAGLIARAQAELDLGDLDRSLETLIEAGHVRSEARLVRIATLMSERRHREARQAIAEARAALDAESEGAGKSEGESKAENGGEELLRRRLDVMLAQIQAAQREGQAAIERLREMVKEDASDLLAWRTLVQILSRRGRAEEALALLEQALDTEEPPVDLLAIFARVHESLGHEAEAEAALRSLVDRDDSASAYLTLVQFYSARDDADSAARILEEAIGRFPRTPALRVFYVEVLLAKEQIEEARAEFRRFREATFDGDPQIDYLEARLELAEGDAEGAADRLRALAPRLDSAATQFWLGRALEETGDLEGANRRYGLAQQRDRRWAAPALALIDLARSRGDWNAMGSHAQRLAQRAPQRMEAWIALVDAHEKLGEGEAAEEVAQQCLERFPDRAEPQLLLAKARRAQGRYDEALEALAAAEAKDGAGVFLAAERVLTLGMGGQLEAGITAAREALALAPAAAPLHAALASLLFKAGAAEEGDRATDLALALDPDEPRPLRVRCEYRAAAGQWPGARDDCTRYLEARPEDAGAHFILGVSLQSLGELKPAAAAYRRAAALDERHWRSRNNLAELLAAEGDLDGALAAAQEAYRLDEEAPHVLDTLGALYLRKGLADRAISLLEEAHAAAPELPEATLHLALAYRETGRTDDARVLLTGLQERGGQTEAFQTQVEEALHSLP